MEIKRFCDECWNEREKGHPIYCGNCIHKPEDSIEDLKNTIDLLQKKVDDFENKQKRKPIVDKSFTVSNKESTFNLNNIVNTVRFLHKKQVRRKF